MALVHSLLRYKDEGRVKSFDLLGTKKATVTLPSGRSILVYMSDQYIIGGSEVAEALESPATQFLLYNNWDKVCQSAFDDAKRFGIEVHTFGAFGFRLDKLNAGF